MSKDSPIRSLLLRNKRDMMKICLPSLIVAASFLAGAIAELGGNLRSGVEDVQNDKQRFLNESDDKVEEQEQAGALFQSDKCFACPNYGIVEVYDPCLYQPLGATFPYCFDSQVYIQCGRNGQCNQLNCPTDAFFDAFTNACQCLIPGQFWDRTRNVCRCKPSQCFDVDTQSCRTVQDLDCTACPTNKIDFDPCAYGGYVKGLAFQSCMGPDFYIQCFQWGSCQELQCEGGTEWDQESMSCENPVRHLEAYGETICPQLPTSSPSDFPSSMPSVSDRPSTSPSDLPSRAPSESPSDIPSRAPSETPSDVPSMIPSSMPSGSPSDSPTEPCAGAVCDPGFFLYIDQGDDCTCSMDCQEACPEGTACVDLADGSAFCRDCSCGSCFGEDEPCCEVNEGECDLLSTDSRCMPDSDSFPGIIGSGDACQGEELNDQASDVGCGCTPSSTELCEYDPSTVPQEDKCFVCNAQDLLDNENQCKPCVFCLSACSNGFFLCYYTVVIFDQSYGDMTNCIEAVPDTCRTLCEEACFK